MPNSTQIQEHKELCYLQSRNRFWIQLCTRSSKSFREGFPYGVLEAGAMGLPSIVTDINGSNEIILPGENGEIIPPRDENALYEKMKEWVEQPEKVTSMASNARRLVETRYEQQMIWRALLDEYQKLLGTDLK